MIKEAVLSLADVCFDDSYEHSARYRSLVVEHERATGETVPRRGTIHDMGRSVTHKAIICYKQAGGARSPPARSPRRRSTAPEEVEYYVQCFRRVQLCRDSGMSPEEIAQATGHSLSLVQEYLELIKQFRLPPLANSQGKEVPRPQPPEG